MKKDLTKILCDAQLLLAETLKEKLEYKDITPQEMNVLRQLLKDNCIEANPRANEHPLNQIAKGLPTLSDEDIKMLEN